MGLMTRFTVGMIIRSTVSIMIPFGQDYTVHCGLIIPSTIQSTVGMIMFNFGTCDLQIFTLSKIMMPSVWACQCDPCGHDNDAHSDRDNVVLCKRVITRPIVDMRMWALWAWLRDSLWVPVTFFPKSEPHAYTETSNLNTGNKNFISPFFSSVVPDIRFTIISTWRSRAHLECLLMEAWWYICNSPSEECLPSPTLCCTLQNVTQFTMTFCLRLICSIANRFYPNPSGSLQSHWHHGPLLLTLFNFNPIMDK